MRTRPAAAPANGKLSPRVLRLSNSAAVLLSLLLAAFALVLQLSSRSSVEQIELVMTGGA